MSTRNTIEQHYLDLAALPSALPAYRHIVELVRKGCADTRKWEGSADSKDRVDCAESLQLALTKEAMRQIGRLSCGALIEVSVARDARFLTPRFPPRSGFGMYGEMPELIAAREGLRGVRGGTHLPGEDIEAVALLLQAAAYLEQALTWPPGFAQTKAQ